MWRHTSGHARGHLIVEIADHCVSDVAWQQRLEQTACGAVERPYHDVGLRRPCHILSSWRLVSSSAVTPAGVIV